MLVQSTLVLLPLVDVAVQLVVVVVCANPADAMKIMAAKTSANFATFFPILFHLASLSRVSEIELRPFFRDLSAELCTNS